MMIHKLLLPTFTMLLKAMPTCFLLLCPLLIQTSVCFPTLLPGGGNDTDRLSLLAFKAQILDDPQDVLRSWNESSHFCEWSGVTCGRRHQRVVALDLGSRQLKGRLAPHIGNLSFLRMIYLPNNSFSQEIPQEIGRLFRLQILYLTNNTLTGEIPVNISRCSKLIVLSVGGNNLIGNLPAELGSLSKLQLLGFSKNNLTEYGMGSDVSTLGDVYSYGIMLLEIFTRKRPTNAIFKDGLNLHTFVESAFHGRLEEVVDPILLREELEISVGPSTRVTGVNKDKILECLASIFEVGVACSAEFPGDRMNISDVGPQLQRIKRALLGKGRHGHA